MLSIVATIKVKDGHQAQFEEVAKQLVAAVNANEPGCKLYSLNKGDDPLTYVFMERYEDEAAAQNHRQSEHFRTLGRAMGEHMDGPPSVLRMKEV
ncbi:MAG TPA: putative quinol monooxygenase [Alphaproteobacteria bacterium]|nr:putative quinol monooxygenase [Alphaproteobacteria bacterium]